MKKNYLFFFLILVTFTTSAQMPDFDGPGRGIINYLADSGGIYRIYNYDPTLPISSTNPIVNSIIPPTGAQGLAVSANLNAPSPSPTFYTTISGEYHWYNGTTWVNTGHLACISGWRGIGAGGGYLYNVSETDSSIYQYNGTGDAVLLTHITASGGVTINGTRDIAADDSGNCYVVRYNNAPRWMRKYNKYGSLVKTWPINGMYSSSNEGLAFIGNQMYTHDGGHRFTFDVYENDIEIISAGSLSSLYPRPTDYASRPMQFTPGTPAASSSNFKSYVNTFCHGPEISAETLTYSAGMAIKTFFGDGISDSTILSNTSGKGIAICNHSYANSGSYTIKQVLFLGSTRIDSLYFSYQHSLCATVNVKFYNDYNNNCAKDITENFISIPSLVKIDSNGIEIAKISATSGFYYRMYGNPGDIYTLSIISTPSGTTYSCPGGGFFSYTIGSVIGNYATKYIGYSCSSSPAPDVAGNLSGRYGRHAASSNILVNNLQCNTASSILTLEHSPLYTFSSAYPPPTSVVGETVKWDLTGLSNISPSFYARVNYYVPGPILMMGDIVNTKITLTPTSGDLNPINNTCITTDTVTGSFDPNAKMVKPDGIIPPGQLLEYTVMFENMGNDTAYDIHIMDTLSEHLDIGSLRLIGASAEMDVIMLKDDAGHHVIKFDFPGINLPDSSHHGLCDGAVVFIINAKHGLPVGTTIHNRTGIYFDNNPVVMTNTTENIIGVPIAINALNTPQNISVYPNPVTDRVHITGVTLGSSLRITDILGRDIYTASSTTTSFTFDTKTLPSGIYMLHIKNKDGNIQVSKFIKE